MTNKGLAIKTVIIGVALAACITGVWVVSTKDTKAEGKVITETAEEKCTEEYDIISPAHFGRTKPAWNKYEGIEVTDFDEGRVDESDSSEEVQYVSVQDGIGTDINGGDSEPVGGDSTPTEGSEPEYAADEYIIPEQEIPVEEPVEEIPAPEESTIVEEPAPEPEPVVEEPVVEEPVAEPEPAPEPSMEYLGDWIATGYCPAECCCGSWAWGATASGAMPTANHTVACNSLPFGTQLMIDGIVYTVEDTGWSPYGDAWVDIFFDTHSEALAWGERTVSVYLVR